MIGLRRAAAGLAVFLFCVAEMAWAGVVVDPSRTALSRSFFGPLRLDVGLSGKVPYRVMHGADPARVILDLKGADLSQMPELSAKGVQARFGRFRDGWSRIILRLDQPRMLDHVGFVAGTDGPVLRLTLAKTDSATFRKAALRDSGWSDAPSPPVLRKRDGRLLVALDPGHGGIDPGAVRAGVVEKDIALLVAQELAAKLRGSERYDVVMTRSDDSFVALQHRVELARAAGADLFLSLHANTVTAGDASGATVYVLSDVASDPQAAALAALENAADLRAGLPAEDTADDIAALVVGLSRTATGIRSRMAAKSLIRSLTPAVGVIRSRPIRAANFQVLRAPDMPSVLLELGFLSNETDRVRMQSPIWRAQMATAVLAALDLWTSMDRGDVVVAGPGH